MNSVSDYLSHLSTLLRSDAAGTFDPDAAEDLARAAVGVIDAFVVSTLARSTGVRISDVGQVIGSSRVSSPPQELSSQRQHSQRVPGGLHPLESPSIPSLRRLHFHVPSPISHEERGELSEHQHVQDRAQLGMREVGSPLAVPGRAPPAGPDHPRPRADDFHPLLRKMSLQEHHLQRVTAWTIRSDPHQLLTLLLLYVGHDGLLRAGEVTSGLTTAAVIWSPGRRAMAIRFSRSKTCLTGPGFLVQFRDAQRSVSHAGVVGHDGWGSITRRIVPLSQETLRHSF